MKIVIRNAGMKQDDNGIKRVSECCKQTVKKHSENGSITKRKRSTLTFECKELLLKHYGK